MPRRLQASKLLTVARFAIGAEHAPLCGLIDTCLDNICISKATSSPWLHTGNASELFKLAEVRKLKKFELRVAHFLGRRATYVNTTGLDAVTAAILRGAHEACQQVLRLGRL